MRILITCGGTGGHIFPAIALAKELKRRGHPDSFFVIDNDAVNMELIRKAGFDFSALEVPRMPYGISGTWPLFIIRLIASRLNAGPVVAQANPDIAVGFGAYISGPVIQTAVSRGVKTVIHEQNVSLGRANRLLFKLADRACLSYENPLMKKSTKCVLTGNPIRQELVDGFKMITRDEALNAFGFSRNRKTLLVLGGSKGSSAINGRMLDMIKELNGKEKDAIQIIHITGYDDQDRVEQAYRVNRIVHRVSGFYNKMSLAYKAAELIVCRAGASTISEIALFGIPALFIPYPLAGSHQDDNAAFVAREGGAVVLKESRLTPLRLKEKIFSIIEDEDGMRRMSENIRVFSKPGAAKALADRVEELLDAQ